jgi:LysR family hydrogen peroxide-inducible transcriptional activator
MEMHQIRYFFSMCNTLNFTRAADRCHVAQPSLSRAINKLEDELGGLLFRRERGTTHLTELGRLMKPHLERIHEATHAAHSDASSYRDLDLALLRIGVMNSLAPKHFVEFFKRIKDEIRSLDLKLAIAPPNAIIESMSGDIDMAFLGSTDLPPRFIARAVFDETYMVACPRAHILAGNHAVPLLALD